MRFVIWPLADRVKASSREQSEQQSEEPIDPKAKGSREVDAIGLAETERKNQEAWNQKYEAERQIAADLKLKLRRLHHLRKIINQKEKHDEGCVQEKQTFAMLRDQYAFELRAMLRQKFVGRWLCQAINCNQSYSRKSHMKGHVTTTKDDRHYLVRWILKRIRCCYCGDSALDEKVLIQQDDDDTRNDGAVLIDAMTQGKDLTAPSDTGSEHEALAEATGREAPRH